MGTMALLVIYPVINTYDLAISLAYPSAEEGGLLLAHGHYYLPSRLIEEGGGQHSVVFTLLWATVIA
jgi:hypothetical protein